MATNDAPAPRPGAARLLGRPGDGIARMGLGCWRLAGPGRPDRETALDTIRAAYDAGFRIFDTADSYCLTEDEHGYGERLLADAVGDRPDVVMVTKGGWARPNGDWENRASPEWLRRAVHDSAERLGRVPDVYFLHAPDPLVPLEDSMAELFRALDEGLVGAVGVSTVTLAEARRALAGGPLAVLQERLAVTVRPPDTAGMLELCERHGLAFMAHSTMGPTLAESLEEETPAWAADDPATCAVAARHGTTPQTVALAWLLAHHPRIVPIPGARRQESVRSSATAATLPLSAADMDLLDAR